MSCIKNIRDHNFIPLFIFAIAMGFLEAIVVVYLRELYNPEGFQFPLKEMPGRTIIIEWIREICTLLMLGSVAWISGKHFLKRLSVFLFIFGVWDIIYYTGLKMFLNWPDSLLTWDVLFLIPITWVGPVLAPVIISLLMILTAFIIDFKIMNNNLKKLELKEVLSFILGTFIVYYTFTVDFGMILIKGNFLSDYSNLVENHDFLKILTTWKPTHFNWWIFAVGIAFIGYGIFRVLKRSSKG